MDRTDEYHSLCQQTARSLGHTGPVVAWTPTGSALPPPAERSPFHQAACKLHGHVVEAQDFMRNNERDFVLLGRVSARDRAQIEADVVRLIRGCEAGAKQLQHALQGAKPVPGARPNAAEVAHLHGVVLVLHTALRRVVVTFEALRAAAAAARSRSVAPPSAAPSMAAAIRAAKAQMPVPGAAAPGPDEQPGQQQARLHVSPAHLALVEELAQRHEQARAVERSMAEVAELNRTIASELSSQSQAAEQLYRAAVAATEHIDRGNAELRKTAAVNRGTGWHVFALLVAAGLALLALDALYPG